MRQHWAETDNSVCTSDNRRFQHEPPSADRWKNRSRTYQGIAEAMASQWGATA